MSEVLAQLEKKGGGERAFYDKINTTTSGTRYDFICGFKPDYVWFRFYLNSSTSTAGILDTSANTYDSIFITVNNASTAHRTLGSQTTEGVTNNGFWFTADSGARQGLLEVTAIKL